MIAHLSHHLIAFVMALAVLQPPAAQAGSAPAPAAAARATWAPGEKSFVGTAPDSPSRVYFTGHRGVVSDVFYPVLDTTNVIDLQFLVGDVQGRFVDEEKRQAYSVTRPDQNSLTWLVTTENPQHGWKIEKRIFTDPVRNALVQRTRFIAGPGRSLADFRLYVLLNPAIDNGGSGDAAGIAVSHGRTLLTAAQGMCGRPPRCKEKMNGDTVVGCGHVFGLERCGIQDRGP